VNRNFTLAATVLLILLPSAGQAGPASEFKISSELRHALRKGSLNLPPKSFVRFNHQGKVQVYIRTDKLSPLEKKQLKDAGVVIDLEENGTVQGWIKPEKSSEIASLDFVQKISLPDYAIPRTGSVTTEADAIFKTEQLRSLGYDGSGIKLGVISDGIGGLEAAQASGDLPEVQIVTFSGRGSEGTAMLEIIHDLAPATELGFCGPKTSLEFIRCVEDLQNSFGADIIVDDLGFYQEPQFEDGPVALAVKDAVQNGVLYVSSAGNDALVHYSGDFSETFSLGYYGPEHNFGIASGKASDPVLKVLVPPKGTILAILQWNDPFGASSNDYDLLMTDESGTAVLAASTNPQDGNDDPVEILMINNPFDAVGIGYFVVVKAGGEDREIRLRFPKALAIEDYPVAAGSVFGHPAIPGVLAVGAISANDAGHDEIEDFSSQGPVEILFPSPEIRQKPDLCGIDGVSVTGAGGFPSPFSGTSASAPHLAGIAALLRSKFSSAQELVERLKESAIDLGDPGFDPVFGAGLVDVFAASGETPPPLNLPTEPAPLDPSPEPSPSDTLPEPAPSAPTSENTEPPSEGSSDLPTNDDLAEAVSEKDGGPPVTRSGEAGGCSLLTTKVSNF
jgi:subtilisin family serine protease